MTKKGLTGKNPLKSSRCVDPAKKEIQQQMSKMHSQESNLLDLFLAKTDMGPLEINSANNFFSGTEQGVKNQPVTCRVTLSYELFCL
jgi:hypothetical protein